MKTFHLSTVFQANLDLVFISLFICGEKIRSTFIPLYAERGNRKRVVLPFGRPRPSVTKPEEMKL